MIKAFIELSETVTLAIAKDGYIIFVATYDCDENVINHLYSRLQAFDITAMTVLTTGTLSRCFYQDSTSIFSLDMANDLYYCYVSDKDIDAVLHLASVLSIREVKLVDSFGYCHLLQDTNFCCIASQRFSYNIYGFRGELVAMANASYVQLANTLQTFVTRTEIPRCYEFNMLVLPNPEFQFRNYDVLPESLQHVLCLFAYSEASISSGFTLDLSHRKPTTDYVPGDTSTADDSYEDSAYHEDLYDYDDEYDQRGSACAVSGSRESTGTSGNKVEKDVVRQTHALPQILLTALSVVMIGVSIFFTIRQKELSSQLPDAKSALETIVSANNDLISYTQYTADDETLIPAALKITSNEKYSKYVTNLTFKQGSAVFTVSVTDKQLETFTTALAKKFTIVSEDLLESGSSGTKNLYQITCNL